MGKELVSIIIPAYNEERYIGKCLESILLQTYPRIEIIVVDDGSKDSTFLIAKKYGVKIIKQKHRGPAIARNFGARVASGKILVFLDADMRYHKNYVKALIRPIVHGQAIGTFNKIEKLANPKNVWSKCWSINSDLEGTRRSPSNIPNELALFRAILKKEFIKVNGYSDIGYGEDSTISKKLNKKAKAANGAISYHYNPETIGEVFYSARWIGRSRKIFVPSVFNLLRFSFLNSLRISLRKIYKGAPFKFFIFKTVYDAGVFCGIFLNFGRKNK